MAGLLNNSTIIQTPAPLATSTEHRQIVRSRMPAIAEDHGSFIDEFCPKVVNEYQPNQDCDETLCAEDGSGDGVSPCRSSLGILPIYNMHELSRSMLQYNQSPPRSCPHEQKSDTPFAFTSQKQVERGGGNDSSASCQLRSSIISAELSKRLRSDLYVENGGGDTLKSDLQNDTLVSCEDGTTLQKNTYSNLGGQTYKVPTHSNMGGPTNSIMGDPTHSNVGGPTHSNVSGPTHGNVGGPTQGNVSGPTHGNVGGPPVSHRTVAALLSIDGDSSDGDESVHEVQLDASELQRFDDEFTDLDITSTTINGDLPVSLTQKLPGQMSCLYNVDQSMSGAEMSRISKPLVSNFHDKRDSNYFTQDSTLATDSPSSNQLLASRFLKPSDINLSVDEVSHLGFEHSTFLVPPPPPGADSHGQSKSIHSVAGNVDFSGEFVECPSSEFMHSDQALDMLEEELEENDHQRAIVQDDLMISSSSNLPDSWCLHSEISLSQLSGAPDNATGRVSIATFMASRTGCLGSIAENNVAQMRPSFGTEKIVSPIRGKPSLLIPKTASLPHVEETVEKEPANQSKRSTSIGSELDSTNRTKTNSSVGSDGDRTLVMSDLSIPTPPQRPPTNLNPPPVTSPPLSSTRKPTAEDSSSEELRMSAIMSLISEASNSATAEQLAELIIRQSYAKRNTQRHAAGNASQRETAASKMAERVLAVAPHGERKEYSSQTTRIPKYRHSLAGQTQKVDRDSTVDRTTVKTSHASLITTAGRVSKAMNVTSAISVSSVTASGRSSMPSTVSTAAVDRHASLTTAPSHTSMASPSRTSLVSSARTSLASPGHVRHDGVTRSTLLPDTSCAAVGHGSMNTATSHVPVVMSSHGSMSTTANHAPVVMSSHSSVITTSHTPMVMSSHTPIVMSNHSSMSTTASNAPVAMSSHSSMITTSHTPMVMSSHTPIVMSNYSSMSTTASHAQVAMPSHSSVITTSHAAVDKPSHASLVSTAAPTSSHSDHFPAPLNTAGFPNTDHLRQRDVEDEQFVPAENSDWSQLSSQDFQWGDPRRSSVMSLRSVAFPPNTTEHSTCQLSPTELSKCKWLQVNLLVSPASFGRGTPNTVIANVDGVANHAGMVNPGGVANLGGVANPGGMANLGGMANPAGMANPGHMANPGGVANFGGVSRDVANARITTGMSGDRDNLGGMAYDRSVANVGGMDNARGVANVGGVANSGGMANERRMANALQTPNDMNVVTLESPPGGYMTHSLPLRNAGSSPLDVFLEVNDHADTFSVMPMQVQIAPYDQSSVTIRYQPKNGTQPLLESLLLMYVEPSGPVYEINLRGVLGSSQPTQHPHVPVIFSNRHFLAWGGVPIGESLSRSVSLRNQEPHVVKLLLRIHGNCQDFQIATHFGQHSRLVSSKEIALKPMEEYTLQLQFTPSQVAERMCKLCVQPVNANTKYTIPLSGYGGTCDITLDRARRQGPHNNFIGQVSGGEHPISRLQIQNRGDRPAYICAIPFQDVACTNRMSSASVTIQPSEFCLSANEMQTVVVVFTPDVARMPRQPQQTFAAITLLYGDEISRQRMRRASSLHPPRPHLGAISVASTINFDQPFLHELTVPPGDAIPGTEADVSLFYSTMSRLLVTLETEAHAPSRDADGPRVRFSWDQPEFAVPLSRGGSDPLRRGVVTKETFSRGGMEPLQRGTAGQFLTGMEPLQRGTTGQFSTGMEPLQRGTTGQFSTGMEPLQRGTAGQFSTGMELLQRGTAGQFPTGIGSLDASDVCEVPSSDRCQNRWSISADSIMLRVTLPSEEPDLTILKLTNLSDDLLSFDFYWPADCVTLSPGRGVIQPRSVVSICMSATINITQNRVSLPWTGSTLLICDGLRKELKIDIVEALSHHRDSIDSTIQSSSSSSSVVSMTTPSGGPESTMQTLQFTDTMVTSTTDLSFDLRNPTEHVVKWLISSVAPAYMKSSIGGVTRVSYSAFWLPTQMGIMQPNEHTTAIIEFCPRQAGAYSQHWEISLHSQEDTLAPPLISRIELIAKSYEDTTANVTIEQQLQPPPKGSIHLYTNNVDFGQISACVKKVEKLVIKNKDSSDQRVHIIKPALPFSLQHQTLVLKRNHYVRLPIEFHPIKAGVYREHLVVKSDDGPSVVVVLNGKCV